MISKKKSLNMRVRESQPFFRIKDAESEMVKKTAKDRADIKKREEMSKLRSSNILDSPMNKSKSNSNANSNTNTGLAERKVIPKHDNKVTKDSWKPKLERDVTYADAFTPFVINDDKAMSKWFVADELYFPKMVNNLNLGPDSLNNLWVSGFLDRQQRDGEQIANEKMRKEIKNVEVAFMPKPKKKKKIKEVEVVETNEYFKLMETCS